MTCSSRVLFLTGIACQLIANATLLTAAEPEANAPYTAELRDPVTHQVDFSAVVTPPYRCKTLKVWLPLPQDDRGQQISGSQLSSFPMQVEPQIAIEPRFGNKFAYFEFHNPQGAQIIRHRFTAKVWDMHWKVDPAKVENQDNWPASFSPYLQSPSLDDEDKFNQLVGQLVPESRGPAHDMFSVMNWIDANLTYDHINASLAADPNHALSQRRGHCSDYHGLCAAMGQKLGYPSRVTYGLGLFPKNSPSHCKVEAYLPPYGWVSFDLSETQKLIRMIATDESLSQADKQRLTTAALQRLYKGYRENSWLLVTRGTNYDLAPKAAVPVTVVRTIYAEADGEPLPEPDPANKEQREFGWMTVHKYEADKPFKLPFKDLSTLQPEAARD